MEKQLNNQKLKMRIGYACIHLGMKKKYRTFRLKTIEDRDIEKIKEVVQHNIFLLGDIIHDNIKNNIYVYRVTADIIPFASNPIMQQMIQDYGILDDTKVANELRRIREWQEKYRLRISMHTSHFVILASPKEEVIEKSIEELKAQQSFLERINGSNLILHVGGAYGDKEASLIRLQEVIKKYHNQLDMKRLTFENDDKTYNSQEVVNVCKSLKMKWVYDFHHERCNPGEGYDLVELLRDYPPDKYHLSSGVDGNHKPPHADYITYEDMKALIQQIEAAGIKEADIMLEAKQKNLAITPILDPLGNGYWCLKNK